MLFERCRLPFPELPACLCGESCVVVMDIGAIFTDGCGIAMIETV